MTQPPDLDEATKRRIEQEEAYRAELRGQAGTPPPPVGGAAPPAAPAKKKRGCGFWLLVIVGIFVLLAIIGSLLPKTPQSASSPAASSTTATPSGLNQEQPVPDPAPAAPANTDGSQTIGVWNIGGLRWGTSQGVGGEYGARAGDGETFVTVRFTLRNISNQTQSYSSMIDQPKLVLSDGSLIDADTMLSVENGTQMIDGQIAPGLKRTGAYTFRVPSGKTSGMEFQLQFVGGEVAKFNLTQ